MSTLTTMTSTTTTTTTVTSTLTQKSHNNNKQVTLVMKQQKMATHVQKTKTSTTKSKKKEPQPPNKKKSVSLPNTPIQQNKRNILPVKARRVERRKEIKSIMTEEAATLPLSESSSSDDSSSTTTSHKKKKKYTQKVDVRDTIYAGPTFNNAPAPSALPLPFVLIKRKEQKEDLSRHSKDLMNILSPQQSNFERDLSEIQRGLRHMLKI